MMPGMQVSVVNSYAAASDYVHVRRVNNVDFLPLQNPFRNLSTRLPK
jgi:hypothetical protein